MKKLVKNINKQNVEAIICDSAVAAATILLPFAVIALA